MTAADKCPKCDKPIQRWKGSNTARRCPHCGHVEERPTSARIAAR